MVPQPWLQQCCQGEKLNMKSGKNLIQCLVVNYFFLRCNMLKHDQWNVPVATLSVSPAGCHSRTLHQVTCLYFEYPCMVNKIPMTWLFSVRTGMTLWGATWSRSGLRSVMTTGMTCEPNWLLIAQTRKELSNFCMRQRCADQNFSCL